MKGRLLSVAAVTAIALLCVCPEPASAQVTGCDCTNSPADVCTHAGYRVRLVNFTVDQLTGVSNWDYQVCNEAGMGTGCDPVSVCLQQIDLGLANMSPCLTPTQLVQISQLSGFDQAMYLCSTGSADPVCGPSGTPGDDFLPLCRISPETNLDPGECVTLRLTIGGEMPTLGGGGAITILKVQDSPDCFRNCVLGPSCSPCGPPPPPPDGCLTRTPGFWGTHPHITGLFLPITVCGEPLNIVSAGSCESVTEALCVAPGIESKKNPAYASLVRALAAAKLNIAASGANGGTCPAEISTRIAQCEGLCGASQSVISGSGCIEDLDAFNNSQDSVSITPSPFDSPGPANPTECKKANGNKLVIGKGACL